MIKWLIIKYLLHKASVLNYTIFSLEHDSEFANIDYSEDLKKYKHQEETLLKTVSILKNWK